MASRNWTTQIRDDFNSVVLYIRILVFNVVRLSFITRAMKTNIQSTDANNPSIWSCSDPKQLTILGILKLHIALFI